MKAVLSVFICFIVAFALCDPLLLTPYVDRGDYKAARELSKVNYAGKKLGNSAFFTVPSFSGENHNNIYFWFQPCQNNCDVEKTPFFIWLQGGPGAPSTFGAYSEIGNWWVDADNKLNERCFSWCKEHNCIFVDQPVQTGFSFQLNSTNQYDPDHIEYTKTSAHAMKQVYELLIQFFKVWPEYKAAPFYVAGESYGGLYTAWLGYTIYTQNQKAPSSEKINFKGLAVGDPVINWEYQMPTYPDTLYAMGVIMANERANLVTVFKNAVAYLESNCTVAFDYWNDVWNDNGGGGAPGLYYEYTGSSMTEDVLQGAAPPAFNNQIKFLGLDEVEKAFHYDGIPNSQFNEGGKVYSTMVNSGDFCSNSSWLYATLFLEAGIDLMIYTSTNDPLLGPPTTEAGVNAAYDYAAANLPGGKSAQAKWNSVKKDIWRVNSKDVEPAGYAKCVPGNNENRFCYVSVRNGGHTLPAFQPRSAYDMITRFLQDRSFDASGDKPSTVPTCAPCGGVPPFAGLADPACVCGSS